MKTAKTEKSASEAVLVPESQSFADTLRMALAERGISQSKCAKILSVGAWRVNGWMRGTLFPSRSECQRIGRLLAMAEFANIVPRKKRDLRPVHIRRARVYTLAEYSNRG